MKALECYSKFSKAPDGLQYTCKACQKLQFANWKINNPDYYKDYAQKNSKKLKESTLKRKFNLLLTEFEAMREKQRGVCAICKYPPKSNRSLSVDHCHQTGQIRELLCLSCNALLGSLENGRVPLEKYFSYLKKHLIKTKLERAARLENK